MPLRGNSPSVPDRKYISGCKCIIWNKLCAQQTAKTCRKAPKGIFDRLRCPGGRSLRGKCYSPAGRSTARMFFSALNRGVISSWPQPMHRRRKSAPVRSTSHRFSPQGWAFFMVRISLTRISRESLLFYFLMASQYCLAACSSLLGPYS